MCIYWLEKKIGDENRNYLKQNLLTRAITDPAHKEKIFFLLRLLPLSLDTANHESNSCASEQNHLYESRKFWKFLFIIWQNGLSSDLLGHSISTGPMVPRSYPQILMKFLPSISINKIWKTWKFQVSSSYRSWVIAVRKLAKIEPNLKNCNFWSRGHFQSSISSAVTLRKPS